MGVVCVGFAGVSGWVPVLGEFWDNLAISSTSTPITPIPSKDSGQAEPSTVKGEGRRWDPAFTGMGVCEKDFTLNPSTGSG